jgi:hypothetical protein
VLVRRWEGGGRGSQFFKKIYFCSVVFMLSNKFGMSEMKKWRLFGCVRLSLIIWGRTAGGELSFRGGSVRLRWIVIIKNKYFCRRASMDVRVWEPVAAADPMERKAVRGAAAGSDNKS